MPQLTPYHLVFHSGVHLGRRGINLEERSLTIPSDTLYAALINAWGKAGGDIAEFTAPFEQGDPPFTLTSTFPFAGEVRFYPLPVDLSRLFSAATLRADDKRLKKIAFFSTGLLHKALAGEVLDPYLFPNEADPSAVTGKSQQHEGCALQGGSLWLLADEVPQLPQALRQFKSRGTWKDRPLHTLYYQRVYLDQVVPRVAVDRISATANIFHAGRVVFADGCGLWLGVHWRRATHPLDGVACSQAFQQVLAILSDDGLGGERTYGYGAFTWQEEPAFELPDPQPGEPGLLLSRYHPAEGELPGTLSHPEAAYTLAAVGGWLESPHGAAQRRKRIHLLQPGSLVCPPVNTIGDLVDVRPTYQNPAGDLPHPVWRVGIGLVVGHLPARREASDD